MGRYECSCDPCWNGRRCNIQTVSQTCQSLGAVESSDTSDASDGVPIAAQTFSWEVGQADAIAAQMAKGAPVAAVPSDNAAQSAAKAAPAAKAPKAKAPNVQVSNVLHEKQAMCVDCHFKGAFDPDLFVDQRGGIFCKDEVACNDRVINRPMQNMNRKKKTTAAEEHVIITQWAMLRSHPLLASATNGVQVSKDERVCVLERACADGISFLRIRAGKKIGYVRSEYCEECNEVS